MKTLAYSIAVLALLANPAFAADVPADAAPAPVAAHAEIGKPAPGFSGTDILGGKAFKLSDLKGKITVLEWTNHLCPFVQKHYNSGNMQKTQKEAEEKGATWVSIVSSAPGREGAVTPEQAAQIVKDANATPNFEILDESGEIGHAYNATSTPTIVVIGKDGNVAYMGAIDDQPSPNPESLKNADNYALDAVNALVAGTPVKTALTQSYGCSIKYSQ